MLTLVAATAVATSLRLARVQESLTGRHYVYQQYVDGVPLAGGPLARDSENVALYVDGALHVAKRTIVYDGPLEPYAEYRDAKTCELLRREPLFWTARARVFDVNPVAKLNDPSLHDDNNSAAAVPDAAYNEVELDDLEPTGMLAGPRVRIVDTEDPFTVHADASQPLLFDRSRPEFEEVNAYYAIDRTQRYLESLGYTGARRLVAYPIPVDAHAASGTDNSYYISGSVAGRGALYFGDGGTDDAEDPDIMLHEFMHAVQDWIAPGAFGGQPGDQSRALAEGYADYWSFSENYAGTVASGRDPFCIGDWDARCGGDDPSQNCGYAAGANCLRRVDSTKTMADYITGNVSGTEHRNGEIWSSALRELFLTIGKRTTDQLVIESYFDTPPSPAFRTMAEKIIDADRVLTGGANAATICSVFTARGILEPADCNRAPRGERTYFQSPEQGIVINGTITSRVTITDARAIERLFVHVRAAHPARGELRITLIAPDGANVILQEPSLDITPDLDVTYTVDALRGHSAGGVWQLQIEDVYPQINPGTLLSWDLGIQFAGDEPLTSRPATAGERRIIPVAGHLSGANGTRFRTDLHILNRGASPAAITLIFGNGAGFAAVKAVIDPLHVVAYDDVVATLFDSAGSGFIEVQGDVSALQISSRTYNDSPNGTYGQSLPEQVAADASGGPLIAPYAEVDDAFRTNYGFTEVGGGSGTVHVAAIDMTSGALVLERDHPITPFAQEQFPLTGIRGNVLLTITVTRGDARIFGYTSVIDNASGDPIYVPAELTPPARTVYVPAINAPGANGSQWRTDVRFTHQNTPLEFRGSTNTLMPTISHDVVGELFAMRNALGVLRAQLAPGEAAASRTYSGASGQFIPVFNHEDGRLGMRVLPVESSPSYRTNIGLFSPSAAIVEVIVRDAAGGEVMTTTVMLRAMELVQVPVTTPVVNGYADILSTAPAFAYVSVIDNRSGDATFTAAQ